MSVTDDLTRIQQALGPLASAVRTAGPDRLDVETSADRLLSAMGAFRSLGWGYLSAITAVDTGLAPSDGHFEVLYHFASGPSVTTFRVALPRDNATVPSIAEIVPPAVLYEREMAETMGISVTGLKDRRRQFLSDDWPPGVFPLRKDFLPQSAAATHEGERRRRSSETSGTFIIPIGPQHPALKEPGHFEFAVDGEIITHASIRLGYVHRGIEKGAEDRSWVQNLYLVERICGICSHIHATAYALGAEALAGVTVPPRAQALRTMICELERIHSHLLWLGVAAHEAGFDTLFMFSWRDRETVMDLLEQLTGNRVNYSANLLGGVKYDVDGTVSDAIRRGMDFLEERTKHYLKIVTTDESFLRRTRGVGAITREQANALGTVGPTARSSGVPRDLRVEAPYAAYAEYPVTPVVDDRCDLEARFVVRIKELFECYRLVRLILDRLPSGDITVPFPRKVPEGEVISRVEAPRGELFYYLRSTGGVKPDRVKVRTPSLCNWAAVLSVAVGHRLADMPMLLVGIDPCFSCNDRSITLRRKAPRAGASEAVESWSWEDLRQYGIRYYGGERAASAAAGGQ